MQKDDRKSYVSIAELAKILGISRVAVFKRVQKGLIPAEKVGRSYVISASDADEIVGNKLKNLSEDQKKIIKKAVSKVVKEYGEALKLLGKE